jgi:hypothetical protein
MPEQVPADGRGHLRATHADRERVIEVLKDAFVHGQLNKGDFDARVGQAFALRTYVELAALTADIPAASPARQPAGMENQVPRSHTARDVVIGLVAGLIVAVIIVFGGLLKYGAFGVVAIPIVVVVPLVLIASAAEQRHSRRQLPPRPEAGVQAPEIQHPGQPSRPGQGDHDPALPPHRPDQTQTDLRSDHSRPGWRHPSKRSPRPRGIMPVPGAA